MSKQSALIVMELIMMNLAPQSSSCCRRMPLQPLHVACRKRSDTGASRRASKHALVASWADSLGFEVAPASMQPGQGGQVLWRMSSSNPLALGCGLLLLCGFCHIKRVLLGGPWQAHGHWMVITSGRWVD